VNAGDKPVRGITERFRDYMMYCKCILALLESEGDRVLKH
jgi:hypothetical protein